jgi:predicted phosphodiesterase
VNDKILGRPIRCNKQNLVAKRGKNYAVVLFIGDTHLGSPQFDQTRFLKMIEYAKTNSIYVFLMGDLIELATRHSVGAGVYEQEINGQSQFEQMVEWLTPLAKKKLILGTHRGNHESRCYELTGVDISKAIARELGIPYLGDACWNTFKVGGEKYSIYSFHGRSGCRFDGTALLALERIAVSFSADLVAMGHTHKAISSNILYQKTVNGVVKEFKKFLLITGSYLKYDGGYAQVVGLPISKLGSPKVKFFSDRHDLSISW